MTGDRPDTGAYFSSLAATYASHRPSYPSAAVGALLEHTAAPPRAADIGCGTGLFTRLLIEAGCPTIGIDPSDGMLEVARRTASATSAAGSVKFRHGTAEATGLPTGETDLITCAQAFHWFDRDRALAEFHRILTPGGRLALIWNVRAVETPFAAAYARVAGLAQQDAARRGRVVPRARHASVDGTPHFEHVRQLTFDNPQRLDWTGVCGRAGSASYFPTAGPVHDALIDQLRRAFETHERDGWVVMDQRTEVLLAARR